MEIKLIYFIPLLFLACAMPNDKGKNILKIDTSINKIQIPNDSINNTYCALLTDTIKVLVKLKVDIYSMDSIVVNVTFYNKEKKEIVLYKPILPSDSLAENTFSVLGENYNPIEHVTSLSNHKYLEGDQHLLPVIVPEIDSNKLTIIYPNQQLNFIVNIARFYNFRQTDRKVKSRKITISYGNLFPYIIGGKQLHLSYDGLNRKCDSPVYFIVESKDHEGKFERVKILLPSFRHKS